MTRMQLRLNHVMAGGMAIVWLGQLLILVDGGFQDASPWRWISTACWVGVTLTVAYRYWQAWRYGVRDE